MKTAADLPIAVDCPLSGELPGSGASRHCDACDTVVVDLSQLGSEEADALLRSSARPACVSYLIDARGRVLHAPSPAQAVPRRRLPLLAGALLLAACNGMAPGDAPKPTPTNGELVVTEPAPAPAAASASASAAVSARPVESAAHAEGCEREPAPGAPPPAASAPPRAATTAVSRPPRPVMKRGKPVWVDPTF